MRLTMLHLANNEDAEMYRKALLAIGNNHPYYQVEFLDMFYSGLDLAKAFLYEDEHNIPQIVMPFYLRSIDNDIIDQGLYFDVTSTWGYSGPLYNSKLSHDVIESFWFQVDAWYKRKNIVSEFVRFSPDDNYVYYSGELVTVMNIIIGELLDIETIWSNYNRKVRKNINKARREELYTNIYSGNEITPEVITLFYDIYIHTMDRANAESQYYNSKEKLAVFMKNCPKNCAIALTFKDDIAIASEIVLLSNDSMFSFIGGTLSDYFALRPNEILKHDVINWGFEQGYKHYVLGGGLGKEDGIYNYKKTFFPKNVHPFIVGKKIVDHVVYNKLSAKYLSNESNSDFFPLYRKK